MSDTPPETTVLFCELGLEGNATRLPMPVKQAKVTQVDEIFRALSSEQYHFHVLVIKTDSQLDVAIETFAKIRLDYPGLGRILITRELNSNDASRVSDVAHRCLSHDCSEQELTEAVNRLTRAEDLLNQPHLRDYASSLGHLPSFPAILNEVDAVLRSESSGVRQVAEIVQRDPGLVTKILQLVNSSNLGLSSSTVNSVKEAVGILGMRTVRNLVLTAQLFESMPQTEQWKGFSFDQLQQRSVLVSQLAAKICLDSGYDRMMQSQARLAGLLLDVGMIVLAMGDGEKYHEVMIRAQELNQPLYVVEKLMLGATHAQVGAFILDRWNLAPEIVRAVLFHHVPNASGDTAFSALTAAHLADSLLPPLFNAMGVNMGGRLSRDYLTSLDMMNELAGWEMSAHDVARVMRN